jgi:hypothetical protein
MKINKKLILGTVPYVMIFIIVLQVIPQIPFEMPINDVLIALLTAGIIRIVVYVKGKNAKKYRKGIEYGSARWGNEKDIYVSR